MISLHTLWTCIGMVLALTLFFVRSKRQGFGLRFAIIHVVLLLIGFLVGGRTYYILLSSDRFPVNILNTLTWYLDRGRPGFLLYGGLIGAAMVHLFRCRHTCRRAGAIADLIAPSLLLLVACASIGCHFHGCCFGAPSESIFSVTYCDGSIPHKYFVATGVLDPSSRECISLYPTQLMYAGTAFLVATVGLAGFHNRPRDFSISALSICLMSVADIAILQLRGTPDMMTVVRDCLIIACMLPFTILSYISPTLNRQAIPGQTNSHVELPET